jgi:hypothetical protein
VPTPRMIVVCLPEGSEGDWFSASEVLDHHELPSGTPHPIYPLRRRSLLDWLTPWRKRRLIRPVRRAGTTFAAGGRRHTLDWDRAVTDAANLAGYRWREWARTVDGLPPARPWADFIAKTTGARSITVDEARRQYEQQPQVTAMLAYNANPHHPHELDPYKLEEFQAGEQAFVVLHWQYAIAGDAVVTADGDLLQPASASLADRLRYLGKATAYLDGLRRAQQVLALTLAEPV